jgi:four helix bundle protein
MDKPHKKLDAWNVAMELAQSVYEVSRRFPSEERFGITAQVRKSAVSIPSNLAEGAARSSRNEFRQFLAIARGSLSELDTQLDLCVGIGILDAARRVALDRLLIRVDKMLYALREAL